MVAVPPPWLRQAGIRTDTAPSGLRGVVFVWWAIAKITLCPHNHPPPTPKLTRFGATVYVSFISFHENISSNLPAVVLIMLSARRTTPMDFTIGLRLQRHVPTNKTNCLFVRYDSGRGIAGTGTAWLIKLRPDIFPYALYVSLP